MLISKTLRLFLESIGRRDEYEFYLNKFQSDEAACFGILCPDAELGDALATAVYVMGEHRGMNLINQLRSIECLIITEDDRLLQSNNLYLNYYKRHD